MIRLMRLKGIMNKKILAYPKHVEHIFEDEHTLSVHSAFKSSLNLRFQDTLVTLQPKDILKTPMSIVLDLSPTEFQNLFGQSNHMFCFSKDGIRFKENLFSLKNAEIVDYDMRKFGSLKSNEAAELYSTLEKFLSQRDRKGEFAKCFRALNEDTSSASSVFETTIKGIFKTLRQVSAQDYVEACMPLLGMGEGLTPSGDDFLCGLLASTYFSPKDTVYDFRRHLSSALLPQLNSTTDISKSYLQNACEGRFMEGVIHLHQQTRQKKEIIPLLNQIASMGHSSGTDFLVGLIFGFQMGGTI